MEKLKYVLIGFILFYGCNTPVDKFESLTAPVILVAKSERGDITVCDKNNKYITIGREYYLALTISNSYKKGDTIYHFKN